MDIGPVHLKERPTKNRIESVRLDGHKIGQKIASMMEQMEEENRFLPVTKIKMYH